MGFWDTKRVTVTGGKGFLGAYILEKLEERGCKNIAVAEIAQIMQLRPQEITQILKT